MHQVPFSPKSGLPSEEPIVNDQGDQNELVINLTHEHLHNTDDVEDAQSDGANPANEGNHSADAEEHCEYPAGTEDPLLLKGEVRFLSQEDYQRQGSDQKAEAHDHIFSDSHFFHFCCPF